MIKNQAGPRSKSSSSSSSSSKTSTSKKKASPKSSSASKVSKLSKVSKASPKSSPAAKASKASKKKKIKTAVERRKGAAKKSVRAPLSTLRVLQAALEIADRDGLEALTMRAVAAALKVEAMSLYHHVASKEQILDGLVELVVGELPVPRPTSDWRCAMRARAHATHEALMRHPWATMLFVARMNIGPLMLRYVDATFGCLRAAGFSWADADRVSNALDAFVYGFTLQKRNFPLEPATYAAAAQSFLPMIPSAAFPQLHGMSLEVIAGRHTGVQQLSFALEVLLDGFDAPLAGSEGAAATTR